MDIHALAPCLAVCIPSYEKIKNSTGDVIKGMTQFHIDSESRKENEVVYHGSLVGYSKMIPFSRNMQEFEKLCISVNLAAGTIGYSKNDEHVNQSGEDCFLWEKYSSTYLAFTWIDKPVIVEINSDYNCISLYHGTGELSIIASRFMNLEDHLMAKSISDVKYQLANELATIVRSNETLAA